MAPQRGERGGSRRQSGQVKSSDSSSRQKHSIQPGSKDFTSHEGKLPTYQKLLNCIQSAFADLLSPSGLAESFPAVLREVKGYLYEREFKKAFGRLEFLEAYTVRWSASRALGYLDIFEDVFQRLPVDHSTMKTAVEDSTSDKPSDNPRHQRSRNDKSILCLGGGAAELCALAGVAYLNTIRHASKGADSKKPSFDSDVRLTVRLVDMADWSPVISNLSNAMTSPLILSPYASAAVKAANVPFINAECLDAVFRGLDLLDTDQLNTSRFWNYVVESNIVTIMFTLNELYTISLAQTQKLLHGLTNYSRPGTLLLVVDSPGSYSTVTINGREKRYPMSWLLDHTLMNLIARTYNGSPQDATTEANQSFDTKFGSETLSTRDAEAETKPAWKKLLSKDSEWFRLPVGLCYPLDLENMRYQIHLYEKT